MFELIYLAFRTDSTRVATYQIGRENGVGRSDHLARAVGFNLSHQLSHDTKKPDGWKNFGIYCQFLNEEYARFLTRLQRTPGTCRQRNDAGQHPAAVRFCVQRLPSVAQLSFDSGGRKKHGSAARSVHQQSRHQTAGRSVGRRHRTVAAESHQRGCSAVQPVSSLC